MKQRPQAKHIRVVAFDDEPTQLIEVVSSIQRELQDRGIHVQLQSYRMDWLYHARKESELYHAGLPMLWIIDLHQRFKLDKDIRDSASEVINDLGEDGRKLVYELYQATESLPDEQRLVPDGVAVIIKARELGIPFFVSSKYLSVEYTAPLLRRIAKVDDPNDEGWQLKKLGGQIEPQSRERLKAKILDLAKPLLGEQAQGVYGRGSYRWYGHPLVALLLGVAPIFFGALALYYSYQQSEYARRSVDLSITPPECKHEQLTFEPTEKGKLAWDLLNSNSITDLPVSGQLANFEMETKGPDNHMVAIWYTSGWSAPDVKGPAMGKLESVGANFQGYRLQPGQYMVLFYLTNEEPPSVLIGELKSKLIEEAKLIKKDMDDANGVWMCERGAVKSLKFEGEDKKNRLERTCHELSQQYETKDPRNKKLSVIFFSVK